MVQFNNHTKHERHQKRNKTHSKEEKKGPTKKRRMTWNENDVVEDQGNNFNTELWMLRLKRKETKQTKEKKRDENAQRFQS